MAWQLWRIFSGPRGQHTRKADRKLKQRGGRQVALQIRGDDAIDNPVNKRQLSSIKLLELAWKFIGNLKGEQKKTPTLAISEREILFLHHAAWARRLAVPGRGQGQHSHDTVALFQSWNEISCVHRNAVNSEITSSWVAAIFANSS